MIPQYLTALNRLVSADILCEVDDPNDILKSMLTQDVLNTCNNNSIPPHEICLAVGDFCMIFRNLSEMDGLANNTLVRIAIISAFCFMVQTLAIAIPQTIFKFRLHFGKSCQLRRTHFPLQLSTSHEDKKRNQLC